MKRTAFVTGGFTLLAVLALSQLALGADTIVGTWKQNMAKSKYSPANLTPKGAGTTKIEAVTGGIKLTNDGVDYEGKKVHTEYTATFDGKEAKITSTVDGKVSPNQDAVVWKKVDDYTYENVAKLKGDRKSTRLNSSHER